MDHYCKKIPNPVGEKRKRFAQEQESARKDVERAFGVLQSRRGIVRYPANTWSMQKLWEGMTACVIMHNMIVEDERPERLYDQGFQFQGENVVPEHGVAATFEQFTQAAFGLPPLRGSASERSGLLGIIRRAAKRALRRLRSAESGRTGPQFHEDMRD